MVLNSTLGLPLLLEMRLEKYGALASLTALLKETQSGTADEHVGEFSSISVQLFCKTVLDGEYCHLSKEIP